MIRFKSIKNFKQSSLPLSPEQAIQTEPLLHLCRIDQESNSIQ